MTRNGTTKNPSNQKAYLWCQTWFNIEEFIDFQMNHTIRVWISIFKTPLLIEYVNCSS